MIDELVAAKHPMVVAWRQQIHKYPELGFQEFKTAKLVADNLRRFGYEVREGVAKTGVIGILRPKQGQGGPAVALRADMDALPLAEQNACAYRSAHEGIMHACGHDGHTACLLGVAAVLAEMQDELKAPVVLIFQPAEERFGGAREVVATGILEEFQVGQIFALHLFPDLPKGEIGLKKGAIMAAQGNFQIRVVGKNAHGAYPHKGIDAIVVGAAILEGLQAIRSRMISTMEPLVVSVGTFHAGEQANIIAGEAVMTGTVRAFSETVKAEAHQLMEQMVQQVAAAYGAQAELTWEEGYPATICTDEAVDLLTEVAKQVVGPKGVHQLAHGSMGSEDFAYYLQRVPGAFFHLGIGPGIILHNPTFDFDEEVLKVGVNILVRAALAAAAGS